MYSSVTSGTDVFCDWPFLGYSCVSLETATNFRFFLIITISWKEKLSKSEDWNIFLLFSIKFLSATECALFFNEEIAFNQQQSTELKSWIISSDYISY